jgi:hypothetical protein
MLQEHVYVSGTDRPQWKAFRFFDVSQVKLADEEKSLLSEVW